MPHLMHRFLIIILGLYNLCAQADEVPSYEKSEIFLKCAKLHEAVVESDRMDTKELSRLIKKAGLYEQASMRFGEWGINGKYLNPLPFDLSSGTRYFILTFKEDYLVSMLFQLKWDSEGIGANTKFSDMLNIQSSFYTRENDSFQILRCWFNPWDNEGNLLVKDERKKGQNPKAYWDAAVGRQK